jgi:hypothetical protein
MTLTPKPGEIRKGHGKVKRYPAEKTHRTCKLFTKFRIVSLQFRAYEFFSENATHEDSGWTK